MTFPLTNERTSWTLLGWTSGRLDWTKFIAAEMKDFTARVSAEKELKIQSREWDWSKRIRWDLRIEGINAGTRTEVSHLLCEIEPQWEQRTLLSSWLEGSRDAFWKLTKTRELPRSRREGWERAAPWPQISRPRTTHRPGPFGFISGVVSRTEFTF